jgi:predicted nucleic acid-binding protein
MNGFALDSNIISFDLKGNAIVRRNINRELDAKTPIFVPPFAYYEVKRGLVNANATKQLRVFAGLLQDCPVGPPVSQAVFEAAVYVWGPLKTKGKPIGEIDILIAAYCKTYNLTLVTNNMGHFKRVSGLALADWSAA